MIYRFISVMCLLAALTNAQTLLPGGSGAGGGGGSSTASSILTGTLAARPATCTGGTGATKTDVYIATDATFATGLWPIYFCRATDTWEQAGYQGNADGSITVTCSVRYSCDIQVTTGVFAGLGLNNTFTGNNTFSTGTFSVASATNTIPQQVVATDPVTCTVGAKYTDTTASPAVDYSCLTTNIWTAVTPAGITPIVTAGQGAMWPHDFPTAQSASNTFQDAEIYYEEITPKSTITVSKVCIYVAIVGLSGSYFSFGYYTEAGARIAQTTPFAADTGTGAQCLTFPSPPTLTINVPVIMAMSVGGVATASIYEGGATTAISLLNAQATPRQFVDNQSLSSPGASQSLPANIGTKSANARFNGWIMVFYP